MPGARAPRLLCAEVEAVLGGLGLQGLGEGPQERQEVGATQLQQVAVRQRRHRRGTRLAAQQRQLPKVHRRPQPPHLLRSTSRTLFMR